MEMMRRCVTLLAFVVLVMGWNAGSSSIVGVSHRRAGGGEGGGSDSDGGGDGDVTYDGRSLIVGGQRRLFFSGSIHYPRSTPQMWPSLITKAKDGGIEVIQTYVFWNLHEPKPGQYDFSGRHDLVKFIKEVQKQGLYVCLRIGPYIESEWAYGGFPFWLHDIPDIVFRSDNQPFKFYMQNFTTKIVELMKSENLYASQGGPIILSQIENEYQNVESGFGDKGPSYVIWAANMAVGLQTGVPWVMCKQTDAPHPVINTCNGMKCGETFTGPNSPNKPSMWTENWTSFYEVYGKEPYLRSAEDIAFHVALFIAAKNGSYVNYYMFHGGTNFGRKASAYVLTSYYDQAPIDEYGLLRQPKWGHLKDLHTTIKNCSDTILEGTQSNFSLGPLQEAYLFEQEKGDGCVAFLINNNANDFADVKFRNRSFQLQPKSISILPDCATIAFNTANVTTEPNERTVEPKVAFDSNNGWEKFTDTVPCFADTSLRADGLLEHMNTTKDESDYLWYTFRLETDSVTCSEPVVLHAVSYAHIAHAFINGQLAGGAHGNHDVKNFTLEVPISLGNAENNISILSVMAGLPDSGAFMERKFAGLSKVELRCSDDTTYDLSNSTWGYQVGLMGETLQIYQEKNSDKVAWSTIQQQLDDSRPLTWYKSKFDAPKGDDPVALNLTTMGKGEAWVNGESIGRYWVSFLTPRGQPSQSLYHIPRSFLQPSENVLVMVEEEAAGNPLGISLNVVSTAAAAKS